MHRVVIMLTILACAAPAGAQTTLPTADGRFALQPVPNGVARLDTRTGVVSICTQAEGSGWACRTAADDRQALTDEIARLESENAELRRRLAAAPAPGDRPLIQRPSERDLDEAFGLMEGLMDRTRRMIERWRDERGQPPATPNRT
jgi:hypothetical protein